MESRFHPLVRPDQKPFTLRDGAQLQEAQVAYQTYGTLSSDRSNAILIFHALTGSQHVAGWNPMVPGAEHFWTEDCRQGWWDTMVGPGLGIDTDRFFVICANYLGGCYGSTGPTSPHPVDGLPWGTRFPYLTSTDIVASQFALLDALGIRRLHATVGASLGGLLAIEAACLHPDRVGGVVSLCAGLETTTLQKILNLEQIHAIANSVDFADGNYPIDKQPVKGLGLARMIIHKTFVDMNHLESRATPGAPRADSEEFASPFLLSQGNRPASKVESYMLHQARKFAARFDANAYLRILDVWQRFDLRRSMRCETLAEALRPLRQMPFQVHSVGSDNCFPACEQERLAAALYESGAEVSINRVNSTKGHDSFLVEPEKFAPRLSAFLNDL